MKTPSSVIRPRAATRVSWRRPRVPVVDNVRLVGRWGFAPAGELPAYARGELRLEPTGKACWFPPRSTRREMRRGLWCMDGSSMVLALDGGCLFAGPVVPLGGRMLWGRGVWVQIPRRTRRSTGTWVKPRAVGTRLRPKRRLPVVAGAAATAALFLALFAAAIPF